MVDFGLSLRRRRRSRLRSSNILLYSKLSRYAFFGLIGAVLLTAFLFIWYSRDLPQPGKLAEAALGNSTRIYDRKGKILYSVDQDEVKNYVKLKDVPKIVKEATIATEDKDFYKNQGFSLTGVIRGLLIDPILRRRITGGSTITQQLIKNVLLTSERTIPRKIKELILAVQVDKIYSKDQILEMYLNNVPFGGTAIGIDAAAETYFGKSAKDLNLAQSAFLAGLPQAPSLYSPFSGNKYYIDRSTYVLGQMARQGYITNPEAQKALEEIKRFKFTQRNTAIKAPHFVMYVREQIAERFGDAAVDVGGLQIKTSLDYDIQKKTEEIVKSEIARLKGYRVGNGSAIVMDPKTGEILAMVGSEDYFNEENDGNFNASLSRRQPGSSLKPVMYATALEKGYTAATLIMDVKTDFPTQTTGMYTPVNYDGKFRGPTQLRFALGNSLNIPAVKMLARVGIKDTMEKGYDMGIKNWEPTQKNLSNVGLSLVLGGREVSLLEEVSAYSVLANRGVRQEPLSVLEVKDLKGKTLFKQKSVKGPKVLSEEAAFIISHILLDNNARSDAFGSSSFLNIPGKTVSVKTGTTDSKRDNWTVGYTPSFVVGVWVGNNDNSPMNPIIASGVTGASPIWNKIMGSVLKGKTDESLIKPANVIAAQIDAFGGGATIDGQSTRSEYFIKGTEPTSKAPIYKEKDGKRYIVIRESDPVSTDGKNRWQEGIDAWIEQNHAGDELWHAPGSVFEEPKKKDEPTPTPSVTPSPTPTPTPTPLIPPGP
ncbi:MAG: hypothetical protein A3I49_01780 [Candidatus Levybacteria bacterium RIFCSPLOWO2_02_FULL_37_11]|nr:MAG: hypothetical protein A3I49_01780 [Candidatus Levybacteria bacterium RIFCSPLOWO2_02_FULL_37_11]